MQNYTQSNLVQYDRADREPSFDLALHFVAISIEFISALLDSGALHSFLSSELVHRL